MMTQKILRLLIASGALVFGLTCSHAWATVTQAKHHARMAHAKDAAKKSAPARKGPRPSLTIVSKAPNNAPDFDYQDRIHEAQDLLAEQPVLKDDMQFDKDGKLSHFV